MLIKNYKRKRKHILRLAVFLIFVIPALIFIEIRDNLELKSPPSTLLLLDRTGRFLSESALTSQSGLGYWPIKEDNIPERIKKVLVHTEDRRFFDHSGIDFIALGRALIHNLLNERRQGASTIAMQVARLQSGNRRNYWSKICEMVTAVWLIQKYEHEPLLRHYLRIVPQGTRYHGVSYAARRYFRKPLQDLSWAEAAVLSALPKAPGRMNLFKWNGFIAAKARAKIILNSMHDGGVLEQSVWLESLRQLRHLTMPYKEVRPYHSYHAILRIEETIKASNHRPSLHGPILTSIDLSVQDRLDQLAYASFDYYRFLGAGNAAFIVADKKTGQVLGYLGSIDYYNHHYSGSINYARTLRSSGSTLKPFIYALGLESGQYTPASVLPDIPFHIKQPTGVFSIANYDERYLGPILYRKALANSRNVPAVYLLQQIGLKKTFQMLERLGFVKSEKNETYYGLGLAIGGLYVSLEDLVAAYGMLGNDGKRLHLNWFNEKKPQQKEHIMSETTTRLISLFLSDPHARLPSFARKGPLEYPFPVAVKTGTSQGFRDAWTVAFSSKYIVGVWMGHPENLRMKKVSGSCSADLANKIMLFLHPKERRGMNEAPFPAPEGYQTARICALTGEVDQSDCPETFIEYLPPNKVTPTKNRLKKQYAVDSRTGIPANEGTPVESLEVRNFLELPTVFDEWKANLGLQQSPYPLEHPMNTTIFIKEPVNGSSYVIDPETPLHRQTVALKATVTPNVPEIDWFVNGKLYKKSTYPYVLRWPLKNGKYTFQARFPNAEVYSEFITIFVSDES